MVPNTQVTLLLWVWVHLKIELSNCSCFSNLVVHFENWATAFLSLLHWEKLSPAKFYSACLSDCT